MRASQLAFRTQYAPLLRTASGPEAYLACVSVAAHFDFTQAKRQVYTRVDPARDESGKFHRVRLT